MSYSNEKSLNIKRFSEDDICKIAQNLDSKKAHDLDQTSICMLKICSKAISKPLKCFFRDCLNIVFYHSSGRKMTSSVLKIVTVPLSPICIKTFGKTIFNKVFHFFNEINLISLKQSSFLSRDSHINQLTSITN